MLIGPRYKILIALLLCSPLLSAQSLIGTWEGEMNSEFLQINIGQEKPGEICGYTYDHLLSNKMNYCKAYFTGVYNKRNERWELTGQSFIESSESHKLMKIKLSVEKQADTWVLRGTMILQLTVEEKIMTLGLGGLPQYVVLKKVSDSPSPLPRNKTICFTGYPDLPDSLNNKQPPATDEAADQNVRKPLDTLVRLRTDTVIKHTDAPVVNIIPKNDSTQLFEKISTRKNITFSRIPVTVKNLTLNVYDNAIVDGDTISIYYNGRMLVNRQRLSEKPIVINLELDEKSALHEIILFAHNLGSIPPNTALIVVNAGGKRYELHSSASLTENAVLVFEYTPK